jgi:TonB family protein
MDGIKGDPTMATYYGEVLKVVLDTWRLPPGVPPNPDLMFDVMIVIDPEGKVLKYEVLAESKNPALNRSVYTFLTELKQLPPPPANIAGMKDGRLELPFRFMPEY